MGGWVGGFTYLFLELGVLLGKVLSRNACFPQQLGQAHTVGQHPSTDGGDEDLHKGRTTAGYLDGWVSGLD